MLVLGLLLILGAALVTAGAVFDAGETATVEILGQVLTTTAAGVFIAGLVTMLMFLIGVWAVSASFGRARRKRAERKAAKRDHRDSVSRLEEERAALREENERLARQLSSQPGTGAATTAPVAATSHRDTDVDSGTTGHDPRPTADDPNTTADGPNTTADDRVVDHRSDLTGSHHATTASDGVSDRHRDPV